MLQLQNLQGHLSVETWVTIGTFDGVHLGHQELIGLMVEEAHTAGAQAAVVTFYPHPAVVLGKRPGNINLSTQSERVEYIERLGVDVLVTQTFNSELAATSAKDYVLQLKNSLNMVVLWVGQDFALGRDREGNIDALKKFGSEMDFSVRTIAPIQINQSVISSSQIRELLWSGEVAKAAELLGKPYHLSGKVVRGDQRGRTIGIPTANLEIPAEKLIPAKGVYACLAVLDGTEYPAATNIGVRPTFDGQGESLHVEAHILDFSSDLYGQNLGLDFLRRLRNEVRFNNVNELIEQIHLDIERTRSIVSLHYANS